ncbi:hypothetical protein Tco_0725601 [Tanacetum coccineum]|uniref:Homologous recombination OB-fold protein OB-fold domain-containing protein n=1 Tax=Tanacetum coccineum TaxID=301880 RepID=A0ABQ4YDB5_9ASTR
MSSIPTTTPHIFPEITTTTQTLILSQNHQVDTFDECEQALDIDDSDLRVTPSIISGPAGIVQTVMLGKLADTQEGREESVTVLDYVNVDGGIVTGCFRDVKKFLKNKKIEKVVAVIKSCTPNALGDLTVTLKDLFGTISGTIHYKVLTKERFAKAITVGAALILHNDFVFSPKQSTHHCLNFIK